MREVIQCLIDWINKDPSDEKPHRILRALAQESLKKAGFEECKRRFTADELVAAAGNHPNLPTQKMDRLARIIFEVLANQKTSDY